MKTPVVIAGLMGLGIALAVAGCINGCSSDDGDPPSPAAVTPLDTATVGIVKGTATYSGAPIRPKPIEMIAECRGTEPRFDDRLVVKDGRIQNAFVWISAGLGSRVFARPSEPATIDQKNCGFVPHVAGVRRYQWVQFRNSDPVIHNVSLGARKNKTRNFSLPASSKSGDLSQKPLWFGDEEVGVPIKCDVHSWMLAYVHVVDHPYFATTGEDGGFELRDVPAGDYTISCWTESLGTQEKKIHVDAKGTSELSFSFTN